jgi:hypothetical protein
MIKPFISFMQIDTLLSKVIYVLFLGLVSLFSLGIFMLLSLIFKCFKKEDVFVMKGAMAKAKIPDVVISYFEKIASYGVG